ncbi:MAG: UPF0149 family protein [Gammaproteobacteria bacterium]|nr:UPF0149 family protein [Gammaproteobacteria bacterium]
MADLTALALNAVDSLSVAEIHGVVCGLAIWQDDGFDLQELIDLVGVDTLTDEFNVEAFVSASVESLMAQDMSFVPLLPEDDADLDMRLLAIAEWCGGFLAGLGAGGAARGLDSFTAMPDEIQEIVEDISAITEIDVGASARPVAGPPVDVDAAEDDYMQIHEFVRVGVLLILSLVTQPPDEPQDVYAQ